MAYSKSKVTDLGRGKELTGFEYCHQTSSTPGNPTFCVINNAAVLLSTHTASSQGSYVSAPSTYDAIESLMAAQGGATTTLTPVNLSGFPTY
jgi:hypothetical protein